MRDHTDLRAQQRAHEEAEKKAKLREEQQAEDYRALMSTKSGRRLMWSWMADTKVFGSTFHTSAAQAAFNEGQRNVGLWLLTAVMKHCPDQFAQMQAENKQ